MANQMISGPPTEDSSCSAWRCQTTTGPGHGFHPRPFVHPLRMNLVCETYGWEVAPSIEQLTDDKINTTLYDDVRSYTLEKADTP